jgi:hypothetical protein
MRAMIPEGDLDIAAGHGFPVGRVFAELKAILHKRHAS